MKPCRIRRIAMAAGLILSLTPAPGQGQAVATGEVPEVRLSFRCVPGVSAGGTCRARGTTYDLVAPETLVVTSLEGPELKIRLADVIRLEAKHGTRSRWVEGAVTGFVIGAGATLLALRGSPSEGSLCDTNIDQDAMGWAGCAGIAAGVGVVTGGVGGLVGSRIRTERWRRIDLPHGPQAR